MFDTQPSLLTDNPQNGNIGLATKRERGGRVTFISFHTPFPSFVESGNFFKGKVVGNRANFLPQNNVPVQGNKKLTRIAIVLDKSGSMDFCQNEVPIQLKNQFKAIKDNAEGDVFVSFSDFDYSARNIFVNKKPQEALEYPYNFVPGGGTALTDSVMNAIRVLEGTEVLDQNLTQDWGYLVVVLTDGGENQSSTPAKLLAEKIHDKQMTGHWTFAFMVPKGYAKTVASHYGALKENVTEWDQTKKEYERVSQSNVAATANYLGARAVGQASVTNYFRTDLSNFDPAQSKLLNVTGNFKTHKVEKETDITTFYNYKTGLNYNPKDGKCFYQLTKKELIQPVKDILVRHKVSKQIFGGDVRKALKMAESSSGVNLKVEPGNHAEYDIFVQSMSPNRKLVRGTEVLIVK